MTTPEKGSVRLGRPWTLPIGCTYGAPLETPAPLRNLSALGVARTPEGALLTFRSGQRRLPSPMRDAFVNAGFGKDDLVPDVNGVLDLLQGP
jgi:hypothetical protein